MAFNFPWQMFLEAQMEKNRQQERAVDLLSGTISNLGGDIGQGLARSRQRKAMKNLGSLMSQASQPIPQGIQHGALMPAASSVSGVVPNLQAQALPLMMEAFPDQSGDLISKMIPAPMNALQLSEIEKNKALAARASRPGNPLDDAIKQKRLELLELIQKRIQSQIKSPNPVPAAALDIRTQIANIQNRPWWLKLGFGKQPKVVNPLHGKMAAAGQPQMTDEEIREFMDLEAQGYGNGNGQ